MFIQFGHNHTGIPQLLMCGVCDKPAVMHNVTSSAVAFARQSAERKGDPYYRFCDRGLDEPFTVNFSLDYYAHSHSGVVPVADYTGNAATFPKEDREDEWDCIFEQSSLRDSAEFDALDRYHDADPNETTYAIQFWSHTIPVTNYAQAKFSSKDHHLPSNYEPRSRNAYVEGFGGFHTEQGYDPDLTAKYALRLLNVFTNKRGKMQVGGVEIEFLPAMDFPPSEMDAKFRSYGDMISVKCVRNDCNVRKVVDADISRDEMEEFVIAVIRHGNNHAANWFRKRDTYYKVHAPNCVDPGNCDPYTHFCATTYDQPVIETPLDFLFAHARVCSDSKCEHDRLIDREIENNYPVLTDSVA